MDGVVVDSCLAGYGLADSCFLFQLIPVKHILVQEIPEIDLAEKGLVKCGLSAS